MELSGITIGDVAFVTKLAGFEHTKYIQGNCVHEKNDESLIPLFIGKTVRDGKIDKKFDWYIPKQIANQLPRSFLKRKCLVLPYVGTIGDLAVFDASYEALLGSNIAKIELNPGCGYSEEFVYYYLKSPRGQSVLLKDEQGGIQKNITMEAIRNVLLPIVDEIKQEKIVAVLSALDDKIALNKKMNQKLEAMAKRLYDYWFVQFDFPDENGRPYKTSGGPMTHNPTLNREIPEGWEVAGFSDFGTFKNGINYDKEEIGDQTVKIVNVRNISESTTYFNIEDLDDITLKTECLEKFITTSNDILLARSGSPGATRLLPKTEKKVIYCGFIIRYQLNENDLEKQLYLFHVLKNYEQITAVQSAGSILKNISQDTLNALTVLNPNLEVLRAFNEKISPIYALLRKNLSELNKLTALRDKLLPLLMNGQVVVG